MAVDLSTDRYMPDRFGPFFEIVAIDPDGVEFSFLAEHYRLDTAFASDAVSTLSDYRGLLPAAPRVCSALAAHFARQALYAHSQHASN